jgi:acetyl-CoA synthetase
MNTDLDLATLVDPSTEFSWDKLWGLFDGNDDCLNIAHECLDRHDGERLAARIARDDGSYAEYTFGELSKGAAQFAHLLEQSGIEKGDRIGVMIEPSFQSYVSLFGAIKRGAVAVPLYTLFGPDAIRDRLDDCEAALLILGSRSDSPVERMDYRILHFDVELEGRLNDLPETYEAETSSQDLAVLQYTSGTSRQLPEAVPHSHRAIVTLARSALFAIGIAPEDRYFCPSSPAWGHGLWHGTIAPWSLGVCIGAYSGRFSIDRLADALIEFRITNFAAASTVYRMLLKSGRLPELTSLEKASYTGEALEVQAQEAFLEATEVPVCGMYGTTETGVILGNFPGFDDYQPRIGALGKPLPGCQVAVLAADGEIADVGVTGEIAIRRRGKWFGAKDLGSVDEDGYFWYAGRADDVIIAAGWTISPLEVERALLSHAQIREAAVVGAPDELKGQIVKAVLVADGDQEGLVEELQELVRRELSPHEYPRQIEFVEQLPRTPNGKVNRRALRPS